MRALLDRVTRGRVESTLTHADTLAAAGRVDDALLAMRRLSIPEFGEVLLGVPDRFPALKAVLPAMPSDKVQQDWTGSAGRSLLHQTAAFVRSMERAFEKQCGRALEGATILDYGCGWGRILRLMYRYSDPARIYGADAWDSSLDICRATRVLGNLARCDEVPRTLPFDGVTFDLVYAFSIFTHLSERTARAVLAAIRKRINPNGLLVVTVRPPEYWDVHPSFPPGTGARTMQSIHAQKGFAFIPHQRDPVDGEITFGDTSIALDHVRREWTDWQLAGHETNRIDPYQLVLFLKPR